MSNSPPPFNEITGTSAIVGKYNQQESIANVDGNARPGQLIVDLDVDPPQLYIGNNLGNISLVASGGGNASLPLSNGTSVFNIPVASGNVTITSNSAYTWNFNKTGTTIFPTLTVTRGDAGGTLTGQTLLFGDDSQEAIISTPNGDANVNINSQRLVINPGAGAANSTGEGGDIYLYAGRGGDLGGSGGDIKIRGGRGPVNGYGGYIDINGGRAAGDGDGGYISLIAGRADGNGTGGPVDIQGGYSSNNTGGNVNISGGTSGNGLTEYGNVVINSGANSWTFDNTGNTTMPGNMLITGNIAPSSNITYDLGNTTNRFKDLYLANSTIYIGDQTISANTTNVILSGVLSGNANGLTDIPAANITGNLSNFSANYSSYSGNLVVVGNEGNIYVETANSGISSRVQNGNNYTQQTQSQIQWEVYTEDALTGPNVTYAWMSAELNAGNPRIFMELAPSDTGTPQRVTLDSLGNLNVPGVITSNLDSSITMSVFNDGANPAVNLVNWDSGTNTPNTYISVESNNVTIVTDVGNAEHTWNFDNTGNLVLPGNTFSVNYANGNQVILGGGGGLPLANGNSNINIPVVDGNVVITSNGTATYTFGIDGTISTNDTLTLSVPSDVPSSVSSTISDTQFWDLNYGTNLPTTGGTGSGLTVNVVEAGSGYGLATINTPGSGYTNGDTITVTNGPNNGAPIASTIVFTITVGGSNWQFDNAGNLTLPGNTFAVNYANGQQVQLGGGNVSQLINGDNSLSLGDDPFATTTLATANGDRAVMLIQSDDSTFMVNSLTGNLLLLANDSKTWNFDTTGNLTLPANTFAVNYANGTQVSLGGGLPLANGNSNFDIATSNGNVTITSNGTANWNFDTTGNLTIPGGIIGSGNLKLYPNSTSIGSYLDTYITDGGDVHLVGGGNSKLILGKDDYANVVIDTNGNVSIQSWNTVTSNTWTFGNTGNLTLPGNTFSVNYANGDPVLLDSIQSSIANGSSNVDIPIASSNVYVNASSGLTGRQWIFKEDGALLLSNTGGLSANEGTTISMYTGNNTSYSQVNLTDDGSANITTLAGTYVWQFDKTGNLTLPGNTFAINYANGTQVPQNIIFKGGSEVVIPVDDGDIETRVDGDLILTITPIGANIVGNVTATGNIFAPAIVQNASTYDTRVSLSSAAGIVEITSNGNSTQFNPSGQITLSGASQIIGGTFGGSGITVAGTQTDIFQNRGGNVTVQVGTSGTIANTWTFAQGGNLVLPNISLGASLSEQTTIQSQRKIIPPLHYSVVITGTTPTVVYTATDYGLVSLADISSMKVTIQIQHQNLGMEFFEVYATATGSDTYYTVSNRLHPPEITDTVVLVDLNGSNKMQITLTLTSGASSGYVTYDSTEFGIPGD